MGRSYRDIDFADRDEQLHGDFFTNAEAIDVAEIPSSELDLSDEEQSKQTVSVRFDSDGFAYTDEAGDETTDGPKPRRTKEADAEPLEPMAQPHELGVTQFGQDFGEVISRVAEFSEVSKLNACRWEHHGTGKKISSKPSVVDYLADVQIVARRVLSPELYQTFLAVYVEGYGENADSLPLAVTVTIQQRCAAAWKKSGLLPFAAYWHHPTPESKLGEAVHLLEAIEEEQRLAARKQRRKTLRKARSKRAPKITTLSGSSIDLQ